MDVRKTIKVEFADVLDMSADVLALVVSSKNGI